jgi:hypothetical protein
MNQEKKEAAKKAIRLHITIILYLLQILFVAMYSQPEVQPFVYVRF